MLFALLSTVMLMSCKRDPVPRDAIPRDKYVDILVDVHIAESIYSNRHILKMDTLQSNELYLSVLEKYKVTQEEMLTTSLYYARNQKEYDKIYADVLSKISLKIEGDEEDEKKNLEEIKPVKKELLDRK